MSTRTLIASNTVSGSSTTAVDFNNISSAYTDLEILMSGRSSGNSAGFTFQVNGNSANYSNMTAWGSGSAFGSQSNSGTTSFQLAMSNSGAINWLQSTINTFSNALIYIPSYAGTLNKTIFAEVVIENNATLAYQTIFTGMWANTAVISQVTFTSWSGENFVAGTTFYLYGIAKA